MILEIGVRFAEVFAAKETAVSRKGGGVGSMQNQMSLLINARSLRLRIGTPQQEHNMLSIKGSQTR